MHMRAHTQQACAKELKSQSHRKKWRHYQGNAKPMSNSTACPGTGPCQPRPHDEMLDTVVCIIPRRWAWSDTFGPMRCGTHFGLEAIPLC